MAPTWCDPDALAETVKPTLRDRYLMLQYGITENEYQRILEVQGGGCFICGRPPKSIKLSVDHEHSTGIVRGILCMACNKAVAYLRDRAFYANRAEVYLTSPPAPRALGRRVQGRPGRSTRKWRTKRERKERMEWVAARFRELGYSK
jgi:hypothetical protein